VKRQRVFFSSSLIFSKIFFLYQSLHPLSRPFKRAEAKELLRETATTMMRT